MDNKNQLNLFVTPSKPETIRLPDEYREYYKKTEECLYCPMKLRHPAHALNHWKLLHAPKPMYFVWGKKGWSKVGRDTYVRAKRAHRATAITKQGR